MGPLRKILNPQRIKLRRRRHALFESLIDDLPRPLNILDVGGSQRYWKSMEYLGKDDVDITLLNPRRVKIRHPRFSYVKGDARNMKCVSDGEFDVVFSNSVIEHVGDLEDQRRMAEEVRRAGKRYFLQTPNRSFPIEPHFYFPLFQFLPLAARAFLLRVLPLSHRGRIPDSQQARKTAARIRLLSRAEIKQLFPNGTLEEEKVLGLTKSFVVHEGFEDSARPVR